MSIRYDILENNTVEVFYDDNDFPSLRQPNYPNGENFIDRADAENWAQLYVASVENPSAPYAPNGPGQQGLPKPTEEELAAIRAQMESLSNSGEPTL